MQNYKDLRIWHEAHLLAIEIYAVTKSFPSDEKFGLISQMRRAAVSIPNNVAEGCGRKTQNDFDHFLQQSLGSLNELDYLCFLSKDLLYLTPEKHIVLNKTVEKLRAMTITLIEKVRSTAVHL